MAGIYLHIPFCKQACHYCDFHFSTNTKLRGDLVKAMLEELTHRQNFISEKQIDSIYFGGGTPSLLISDELVSLINHIHALWEVRSDAEITLEANPDDLVPSKLAELSKAGINRLSIGIQSFDQVHLEWMNRGHNSTQALQCIPNARDAGFENLSIDLIYGFPLLTDDQWRQNIRHVIKEGVPHISCYSLTVEPQTALSHFIESGKTQPPDDEQSVRQFDILIDELTAAGYEHYEISNFAMPGHWSKHNRSYWTGANYLGVGPSAHSYNGIQRCWNVRNNHLYIRSIQENNFNPECENIDLQTAYNEYILTGLRMSEGIDVTVVQDRFGIDFNTTFRHEIQQLIAERKLIGESSRYRLSRIGKRWADDIAAGFFMITE